jgi:hypothetical protein
VEQVGDILAGMFTDEILRDLERLEEEKTEERPDVQDHAETS